MTATDTTADTHLSAGPVDAPAVTVGADLDAVIRRPTRADARRNFDALVTAARAAFAEQGTDASLEEIARRAGVGIGTLYRNFPTRDALVEAAYVEEVQSFARDSQGITGEPWPAFLAWVDRAGGYLASKRVLLEGINRDSPVMGACRGVIYAAGEPVLARAQAAGDVRDDAQIEDVVRMIAGISSSVFPDDAAREKVIGFAVDGLRAR